MNQPSHQSGFSAAELLITLFIASIFLIAGYQLYVYVTREGQDSSQMSKASNIAYQYLRSTAANTSYIKSPCSTTSQPGSQALAANTGLNNASVNVVVSCPYTTAPLNNTSLLTATVTYSAPNGQETVTHAMFAKGLNTGPPLGPLTLSAPYEPGIAPTISWNNVTGPGLVTYSVRYGVKDSGSLNTPVSTCQNITVTQCKVTGLPSLVWHTAVVTASNPAGATSSASIDIWYTPP